MVGDLHHHAHVVLDQQDRGAVLVADREQQLVELGGFARIEAGRRLVEAEQRAARCTWRARSRAGAARRRAGRPPGRRRGRAGRCARASRAPLDRAPARRRDSAAAPSSPRHVKPDARISVLCCATSRFSSTVMPGNSRMFWKVRATFAFWPISEIAGMRSSRIVAAVACAARAARRSACRSR